MLDLQNIFEQALRNVAPQIIEKLNFYLQMNMVLASPNTKGANPSRGEGTLRIITGKLLKSFQLNNSNTLSDFTVSNSELTIWFGSKLDYAPKNEYGIGVPARPFFNPAIQAFEADGLNDVLQEILKEIQKIMSK